MNKLTKSKIIGSFTIIILVISCLVFILQKEYMIAGVWFIALLYGSMYVLAGYQLDKNNIDLLTGKKEVDLNE